MDTQQNFGDDSYDFDPSSYQGQNVQTMPQPGIYVVRATSFGPKKDRKTDQPVVTTFGTVNQIKRVEIIEPEDNKGAYGVFKDISPVPFKRGNSPKPNASVAMDLVAAVDKGLLGSLTGWDNTNEVAEMEVKAGTAFKVRLGYEAVDIEGFKSKVSQLSEDDKAGRSKAWRDATYRTKHFRRGDGQGYNTNVTTPDGRQLTAKLVIDGFIASDQSEKLGPFYGQKQQ